MNFTLALDQILVIRLNPPVTQWTLLVFTLPNKLTGFGIKNSLASPDNVLDVVFSVSQNQFLGAWLVNPIHKSMFFKHTVNVADSWVWLVKCPGHSSDTHPMHINVIQYFDSLLHSQTLCPRTQKIALRRIPKDYGLLLGLDDNLSPGLKSTLCFFIILWLTARLKSSQLLISLVALGNHGIDLIDFSAESAFQARQFWEGPLWPILRAFLLLLNETGTVCLQYLTTNC